MVERSDPIVAAMRDATLSHGTAIWSEPTRLRAELLRLLGSATADQLIHIDAAVMAAAVGIPSAFCAAMTYGASHGL